jgi:DNA repair exonuclease SbcCD nuclease subunit
VSEGPSASAQAASSPTAGDRFRLLLFSDLRLDTTYEWAPPEIAVARREAAREALVAVLGEARHRSVDAIACAGDLFNRRTVKPANVQWLAAALRSMGVPVLIAPGNEDFIGPLGGYTAQDWPDNVTVFESQAFEPVEIVQGVTFWGAAHTEAHRSRSFLDGFRADRPGTNIALFHGAETSGAAREPAAEPCAEFDESALERAGFDHALVGHYDLPHFGQRHTYAGAPIAHRFGVPGPRGAVVVTFGPGGVIDRELVPISSPGLQEIEVDLTGAGSERDVLRRIKDAIGGSSDVVLLVLVGRLAPDIVVTRDDLARLTPTPEGVIIQWDVIVDIDVDRVSEEPTIRGQFVRDVMSSDVAEERQQRTLLIGLRALAGDDQLEGPR